MRPTSALLAKPFNFDREQINRQGFWAEDDPMIRWVARSRHRLHVVGEGAPLGNVLKPNVVTRRMRWEECDGRDRVGIFITEAERQDSWPEARAKYATLGIVLNRTIHEEVDGSVLCLSLASAANRGRRIDYLDGVAIGWWLRVLISTDLERLMRRDLEIGRSPSIRVMIDDLAPNAASEYIVEDLAGAIPQLVKLTIDRIGSPQIETPM